MSIIPNLEWNRKLPVRILIYFAGSFIGCCGTALVTLNAMGSDAMNTLFTAVATKLDVLPGIIYTIFNSTMLIAGFLFARRYIGIGSILMILVQGPFLNFWMVALLKYVPWLFVGWWPRLFAGLLGFLIRSIGGGFSFCMQLGTAGFEACLYTLADTIKLEYKYIKTATEFVYFAAAFFLDGVYGLMTVIQVFCGAFVSSYFVEKTNRKILVKWGLDDERNNLSRNRRDRPHKVK